MVFRPREIDIEDLREALGPFVKFGRQTWIEVTHGCKNTRFQVTPFTFIRKPLDDPRQEATREAPRSYCAFHHNGEFYVEPQTGDGDTLEAAVARCVYAEEG